MSTDISRQHFDPKNDYSGVLAQQGRVQLDADWNEWVAILDRRWRAETTDLFWTASPGQAVVLYDSDVVLGGGWIDSAER